jgi:hypothetical protein
MLCRCSSGSSLCRVLPLFAVLPDRFIVESQLFQLTEVDAEAAPSPHLPRKGAMVSDGPPQPEHFFEALEGNRLCILRNSTLFPLT